MTSGTAASGTRTRVTMAQVEAPASRAASIMASGMPCTPEVAMSVANGRLVQTDPMTTATVV
jgi:hypothetical protein